MPSAAADAQAQRVTMRAAITVAMLATLHAYASPFGRRQGSSSPISDAAKPPAAMRFPSVRQVWPRWPYAPADGSMGERLPAWAQAAAKILRAFPHNRSLPAACRYTDDAAPRRADIAIVMADNRRRDGPKSSYHYFSARSYTAYANAHGYKFYYVQPNVPVGHALHGASSSWQKLFAVEQLMSPKCSHEFLFVVDSDSYIARPTLRLEGLLLRLGLLDGDSVMAAATEWPSPDWLGAGFLNGGLTVWRCGKQAREMLDYWQSYRTKCLAGGITGVECNGVDGKWPHEQFSLGHWLLPRYQSKISTPLAGCPLGSAWGDFYVHLVSGVVHSANGCGDLFDARPRPGHGHDRMKYLRRAARQIEAKLALLAVRRVDEAAGRVDVVPAAPSCPNKWQEPNTGPKSKIET